MPCLHREQQHQRDRALHREAGRHDAAAMQPVDHMAGEQRQQQRRHELVETDQPRSQALPVRSYMCQPIATSSIWLAAVPNSRADHSRMKGRSLVRSEKLGRRAGSETAGIGVEDIRA